MPDIYPIFDVFDMHQSHVDQIKADAGLSEDTSLNHVGGDLSLIHPVYGEMLIGMREGPAGDPLYRVMLLTTDIALYNRARCLLAEKA